MRTATIPHAVSSGSVLPINTQITQKSNRKKDKRDKLAHEKSPYVRYKAQNEAQSMKAAFHRHKDISFISDKSPPGPLAIPVVLTTSRRTVPKFLPIMAPPLQPPLAQVSNPINPPAHQPSSEESPLGSNLRAAVLAASENPVNLLQTPAFFQPPTGIQVQPLYGCRTGCPDKLANSAVSEFLEKDGSRSVFIRKIEAAIYYGSVVGIEAHGLALLMGVYRNGRDYAGAFHMFALGCARNSAACFIWSGFCFELGLGTKRDYEAARGAYTAARRYESFCTEMRMRCDDAMQGNNMWLMMKMSLYFIHVDRQILKKARRIKYLHKAAVLGFREAQVYFALILMDGSWVEKDVMSARRWLNAAAGGPFPCAIAERLLAQSWPGEGPDE